MYEYSRRPRPINWYKPLFWGTFVFMVAFALLAWSCAQPLDCDRVTTAEDGSKLCSVVIGEKHAAQSFQAN